MQSFLEDPQDLTIFVLDEPATHTSLDIVLESTTFNFFELPTELVPLPVSAALEIWLSRALRFALLHSI